MNKKYLLLIILVPLLVAILLIMGFHFKKKYNNLVIDTSNWNSIISSRNASSNTYLESIKFNDFDLIIDGSMLYYSVINIRGKYNPKVDYKGNANNIKIAMSKEMNDNDKYYQIIVYDDNYYHIYTLVLTDLPIFNITYKNMEELRKNKVMVDISIIDNNNNLVKKIIRSDGKLTILNNKEYLISLTKYSPGRNKRENNVSIFGMDKEGEYVLKPVGNSSERVLELFINNKYMGRYTVLYNERKSVIDERREDVR